uniref:Uncharacterized protein n=1 Tax=Globodera rostochiensis TaxID=31243 RepID=A0A914HTX4_GLORO
MTSSTEANAILRLGPTIFCLPEQIGPNGGFPEQQIFNVKLVKFANSWAFYTQKMVLSLLGQYFSCQKVVAIAGGSPDGWVDEWTDEHAVPTAQIHKH